MLVGSADILIVMFSRSLKDGTSRIQHVQTFRSQKRWNFKDSTCVCAFVGVLSDMESRVGWLCRHFDSHVFVCVSSIELWEPSQRENVGEFVGLRLGATGPSRQSDANTPQLIMMVSSSNQRYGLCTRAGFEFQRHSHQVVHRCPHRTIRALLYSDAENF